MKRAHAMTLLIFAALCWSLGGVLIKQVDLHPMAIAGWRSAIACGALVMWSGKPTFNWSLPQVGGALAFSGNMFSLIAATKLTTAANAILLQYTAPAYVALFGIWFLKERPRPLDWLVVGVTLGGMVLFFQDSLSFSGLWGNIMGIVAGITFAWLILFLRKQKKSTPINSVILGNALTALVALPFIIKQFPSAQDWLWLILLGTLQTAVPYILYTMAIRHVSALDGVLVPVIEPLLNPTWTLLILGEVPGKWAMAGGAIILLAVTSRALFTGAQHPAHPKRLNIPHRCKSRRASEPRRPRVTP
jgi:drug/metabolite transporter (DMT)-like permease